MAVKVQIPSPLRSLTGGAEVVEVEAVDVDSLIEGLESRHRGIKERLCDPDGKLRRYVRIFVNDEDVRTLQDRATTLKPGDTVAIVPAIAGGAPGRVHKSPSPM
ncbi:MAG TPA: MoaD/ThiS family protein [Vicinamibacteria bacterium]|jgi:molybdopterin synthase sulfur carrier subunit